MNEEEIAAGLASTPGFRYADVVGDELFVAGQVPLDASGALVGEGDPRAQTAQCLDNLDILLGVHGFGRSHVRRLTVSVVGDELAAAWDVVRSRFDGDVPPATLVGVARLGHPGQLVEVDATVRR